MDICSIKNSYFIHTNFTIKRSEILLVSQNRVQFLETRMKTGVGRGWGIMVK